ncbi:unnamed protein product [Owenia fusiformis]|uniref:Paraoxonase n=1 Tax=Owenia fusiformis TaxID=6347 RepID=A0A8J1U6N4_OWEFU|nr:unnamed protein product [Owenia fusiformis]
MYKTQGFIAVTAVLGYVLFQFAIRIGVHRTTVFPHFPGPCRSLPGIEYGSEDVETLPDGQAFISSGFKHNNKAAIFLFNFEQPDNPPIKLDIKGFPLGNLEPLGISIYVSDLGDIYLYVVNVKSPMNATIEKFQYDKAGLVHIKTLWDPNMGSINDIKVVGNDQFYYTNFNTFSTMIHDFWISNLWMKSVCFFNGKKSEVVVYGLRLANGINASPDGKHIILAEMGERSLNVYTRNSDNSLTKTDQLYIDCSPDNIDIDNTGDIWVGCFPSLTDLFPSPPSGAPVLKAQVLKFELQNGKLVNGKQILQDDRTTLKGSTIAVKYKEALLVGSHTNLAYCKLE